MCSFIIQGGHAADATTKTSLKFASCSQHRHSCNKPNISQEQ